MSWGYLMLAILLEVSGTTSMKLSQGFTKIPTIGVDIFMLQLEPWCADARVEAHRC